MFVGTWVEIRGFSVCERLGSMAFHTPYVKQLCRTNQVSPFLLILPFRQRIP